VQRLLCLLLSYPPCTATATASPFPHPAAGSATLWVYSTLLMQKRVPNVFLGRISGAGKGGFLRGGLSGGGLNRGGLNPSEGGKEQGLLRVGVPVGCNNSC